MNNKFNRKDISSFDPTNASTEEIRKWLFAIIDAELDKAPKDRDYDLIAECSEFESELPGSGIELSESEYVAGLERIMAQTPATEHKVTKILEPKKKTKKTVRIVAILAASIAALILSLTVAASVQGKTIWQFVSDNVKIMFGMDTGDKLEDEGITLVKNGEIISCTSIADAVKLIDENMLYPTYLPEGVKIEKIVATNVDAESQLKIFYVSNDSELSIMIDTNIDSDYADWNNATIYSDAIVNFYLIKTVDGDYQAVGVHEKLRYIVKYNDYSELIDILGGIKEIEK